VLRDLLEPAEVKDFGRPCSSTWPDSQPNTSARNTTAADGELAFQLFYSYLLPQFEGITAPDGKELHRRLSGIVGDGNRQRLKTTLADVLGLVLQDRPTPT
jgi:hypothetical protein